MLEALARLAENSRESKERVSGEIEVSPRECVIPFTVNFGSSVREAERSFKRWIKENEHRFSKGGRSLVGKRAGDNPCAELKDLAAARLLSLFDFDPRQASKWTREFQLRDSSGRTIRWFNTRSTKTRSPLFEDLRDWTRARNRFEKNLQRYLVSH